MNNEIHMYVLEKNLKKNISLVVLQMYIYINEMHEVE